MQYRLQHSNQFRVLLSAYFVLILFCLLHFNLSAALLLSLLSLLATLVGYELQQQKKPLATLVLGQHSFSVCSPQGRLLQLKTISLRPLMCGLVLLRGRRYESHKHFWQSPHWGLILASDSFSKSDYVSFLRHCIALQEQELVVVEPAAKPCA